MQQDDIRFSTQGQAGLVLIDRPKALNALSFDMAVPPGPPLGRRGAADPVRPGGVGGAPAPPVGAR
ncbi:MAG: hypothetical protein VX570_05255, partial [Pseudomonadota bacterium]|nr:hypothetical protein [Pseudomonadota bacterium]